MTAPDGHRLTREAAISDMTSIDRDAFERVEVGLDELAINATRKHFQWYWADLAEDFRNLNQTLVDAQVSGQDPTEAVADYAASGHGSKNRLVGYLVDAAARRKKSGEAGES